MISTQNTNMKERIWIERVASEIAFQSFCPAIGVSLHNEHANAVLEEPTLHFESFQRDVADGMRQHLKKVQPFEFPLVFPRVVREERAQWIPGAFKHCQIRGVGSD